MEISKKYWFSYNETKLIGNKIYFSPATVQTNNTIFESDSLDEIETEIIKLGFDVPDSLNYIREKWAANYSNQQVMLGQTDISLITDYGKPRYQLSTAEKGIIEAKRELLRDIGDYSNPSDPALLALFNYDTWGVREDRILRIQNIKGWWSVKI